MGTHLLSKVFSTVPRVHVGIWMGQIVKDPVKMTEIGLVDAATGAVWVPSPTVRNTIDVGLYIKYFDCILRCTICSTPE